LLTYRTLALTAALMLTPFPTHGRAEPAQRERAAQRERLAPPAGVTCTGGDQTVYFGRVTAYRRAATYTSLRIRTDYGTTEQVIIRHRRGVSPARWFLLDAEPFKAEDWRRIESRRGQLRPRMRANAWVCSDGSNPVVDWRPTSG
jgi:hypothetical protein